MAELKRIASIDARKDSHALDESRETSAMDRRAFMRTAGGLLVAAGLGCTNPEGAELGTVQITITGLASGAADAGTVTVSVPGGDILATATIPNGITDEIRVAPGTYDLAYAPPTGYVVAPGSAAPTSITVVANKTTVVELVLAASVQVGGVQLMVTGLAAGLANGGTATVTPSGGGIVVNINVSSAGSGSATLDIGTYVVDYTPPSGYTLSSGLNPRTVIVSANQTLVVQYAVAPPIPLTGTLQISVTGIAADAANGGSAVVTPAAGGAPVTVNVNITGSASAQLLIGDYSVTYTPPANYTLSGGANPQLVSVIAGQTAIAGYAVTPPVSFATPNILNNASFESDFDGFTNWSGGVPTGVTRDTAQAFDGATAIKKVLPVTGGADIGSQFVHSVAPGYDRLWVRFYFYLDAAVNGTLKFNIWFDTSFNQQFGGLFLETGRLSAFTLDTASAGFARLANVNTLVAAWHSLELDYWRNGDTSNGGKDYPSMAIYLDGAQITGSILALPNPMSWINGRLNFGARTTAAKLGYCELLGLLNGTPANTIPGNIWVDKVALSSVGRIGP